MQIDPQRKLRHDLRSECNQLRLCAEVLAIVSDFERIEFLDQIIEVCERFDSMIATLAEPPVPGG